MIDLNVKLALVAAIAWMATRRVTPANAAWAHRLWVAVAMSPLLWLAGEWLLSPVAYAGLRHTLAPAVLTPSPKLQATALAGYAAIAALLLLRTLWGAVSVHRLLRDSAGLREADVARARSAAGRRGCDIRVSRLGVPVTAGFGRPVILLPAQWYQMSEAGLEAVLRHEAAHVRRRDCLVALLCAVGEAVLWFNPAVWLAGRQVRWFAEMACDAEAARAMKPDAYAAQLLELAAQWNGIRPPLYAVTAGAETNVGRRIQLLLDELESGWRRRTVIPVIAGLVLAGMPIAATVRLGVSDAAAVTIASENPHDDRHRARHSSH